METAEAPGLLLSLRLRGIADMVRRGGAVADVGADHGQLGLALLSEASVPRVLALDLRRAPLAGALKLAQRHGLDSNGRFEIRLSDGLAALRPGEADTIVFAGLGGGLIRRLLERAPLLAEPQHAPRLVIQPNLDAWRIREWARAFHWMIVDENLITDGGRHYPVIALERTLVQPLWDEADLRWGPVIRRKHGLVLDRSLAEDEKRLAQLVSRLPDSQTQALQQSLLQVRVERARIREAAVAEQTG